MLDLRRQLDERGGVVLLAQLDEAAGRGFGVRGPKRRWWPEYDQRLLREIQ